MFREKVKIYLEVIARFDLTGGITPLSAVWHDGRTFEITRVYSRRIVPPRGGSFYPVRYDCLISGCRRHLYFEPETGRWFVELGE